MARAGACTGAFLRYGGSNVSAGKSDAGSGDMVGIVGAELRSMHAEEKAGRPLAPKPFLAPSLRMHAECERGSQGANG
jgi:hypothetical protein